MKQQQHPTSPTDTPPAAVKDLEGEINWKEEENNRLPNPSLLSRSTLFSRITVAIADPDPMLPHLVKNILSTLGCTRIFIVSNGQAAIDLMKTQPIDILITEWHMKSMDGVELATYLRKSPDSPNRMVPIIMLTASVERRDIEIARDAGISEFLIKPFSAKTLLEHVHAVVVDPRSFIICKDYVGPDRRRISSLSLPPDPDKNRSYFERKPALIVPKEFLQNFVVDDQPRMIMPDYTLQKKIGFEVPQELIVNPLTLAKSEEEIQNAHEDFVQSMMKDVEDLQKSYQMLVSRPEQATKIIKHIAQVSFSLKSRAGVFGYSRGTEVANQLYQFCIRYYDRSNKNHLIILEKHIQTLSAIFAQKVVNDGGDTGAELIRDLARLINRYVNSKE